MTFRDRFVLADEYLAHTDVLMSTISDDFIKSRYLGFIAVAAVTAYELAIKDIIFNFSDKKHRALGQLARSKFDRLNGQIRLSDLKDRHVLCFGKKYKQRFVNALEIKEQQALTARRGSIKSSYGNLIVWRHGFVHEGEWPSTASYRDLQLAYENGKSVVECLHEAMQR